MAQYQKMEPTVDPKYMDAAAYLMNSSQTDKFLGRNVKNSGELASIYIYSKDQ